MAFWSQKDVNANELTQYGLVMPRYSVEKILGNIGSGNGFSPVWC